MDLTVVAVALVCGVAAFVLQLVLEVWIERLSERQRQRVRAATAVVLVGAVLAIRLRPAVRGAPRAVDDDDGYDDDLGGAPAFFGKRYFNLSDGEKRGIKAWMRERQRPMRADDWEIENCTYGNSVRRGRYKSFAEAERADVAGGGWIRVTRDVD